MHAVFMGMPTAISKGGVPLTGMQPLTTMARQTLEAACIGSIHLFMLTPGNTDWGYTV